MHSFISTCVVSNNNSNNIGFFFFLTNTSFSSFIKHSAIPAVSTLFFLAVTHLSFSPYLSFYAFVPPLLHSFLHASQTAIPFFPSTFFPEQQTPFSFSTSNIQCLPSHHILIFSPPISIYLSLSPHIYSPHQYTSVFVNIYNLWSELLSVLINASACHYVYFTRLKRSNVLWMYSLFKLWSHCKIITSMRALVILESIGVIRIQNVCEYESYSISGWLCSPQPT